MQAVQKGQRARVLQQPSHLGPHRPYQHLAGRRQFGLGVFPVIESPIGTQDVQGRLGTSPALLQTLVPAPRTLHRPPGCLRRRRVLAPVAGTLLSLTTPLLSLLPLLP